MASAPGHGPAGGGSTLGTAPHPALFGREPRAALTGRLDSRPVSSRTNALLKPPGALRWHRRCLPLVFCISTDSGDFCASGYDPTRLYFVVQIVAVGSSRRRLPGPSADLPSFVCSCSPLSGLSSAFSPALRDAPGPSCVFPAADLESAVSPRSPGSFYRRAVFETETQG